ncbi:FHA domain-containing protein [Stieleria marina]|uniref:FHA domain-containing protein n=1 Tax=Stieleria marina TaxID=1930275 RepID=UPI003AF3D722
MSTIKLILNNSEDRVEAPIFVGYYLLGRDKECQIRPKSTSIADRHCLLEHRQGLLRVFDLDSRTGTFVNGEKIAPHQWHFLNDDDRLRCGKLEFLICVESIQEFASAEIDDLAQAEESADSDFDSDVFSILEEADSKLESVAKPIQKLGALLNELSDDSGDVARSTIRSLTEEMDDGKKAAIKKPKPQKPLKIPKGKPLKSSKVRAPLLTRVDLSDQESIKMVGSLVLILAAISLFGYQFYKFSSPTPPRIVSEEYDAP